VAGGVQGDGADGLGLAERHLVGGAGAQLGRLAGRDRLGPAERRGAREPVLADALEPRLVGEALGAAADHEHVRRAVEDDPRQRDGWRTPVTAAHGAGAPAGAVHDRRVELHAAVGGGHRAAAGVEPRRVLEHLDRRLHGVDGAAAAGEDLAAGAQRLLEGGVDLGLAVAAPGARPGVHDDHGHPGVSTGSARTASPGSRARGR
jgi:hypothetical protein